MVGCAWSRMLCLVVRSFLHVSQITMRFLCVDCVCRGTCLKHQWKLWLRNNRGFCSRVLRDVGGHETTIGRLRVVFWRNKSQTGQQMICFSKGCCQLPSLLAGPALHFAPSVWPVPVLQALFQFPEMRPSPCGQWCGVPTLPDRLVE